MESRWQGKKGAEDLLGGSPRGQVGDGAGVDQSGKSRHGEKWSDSGHVSKLELTACADELRVESKSRIKDNSEASGLSN